jgi:cell division control protein 45
MRNVLNGFFFFLHSEFGLTFLDAKEDSGARTRHSSFDTNVLEVNEADFEKFIAEVYNAKDKY